MDSETEKTLVEYLVHCNDMYFGLSAKETRGLAFDLANKLNLKVPASWEAARMAGEDWLSSFLKRHPMLSIRKPEATSLARATSFNRTNVERFFALLRSLMEKHHFQAHCIWNMDETGITTVQTPNRVIGRRGVKQVGRVTSAERGTLVTLAMAVSATGHFLPPFFIFPRKNFKQHFLNGGPSGCTGVANSSGWMNAEHFVQFLQFFQSHVRASVDAPVLLILDNHESHLSIAGLEFCKANGIVLLSLPPHCSHKMQPLDRTVFGPLKKSVHAQCDNWMSMNPGRTMTIYDIPGIVAKGAITWSAETRKRGNAERNPKSLPLAVTYQNIVSGFECTGIYPLNPDIFQEYEFLPSSVTDREMPSTSAHPEEVNLNAADQDTADLDTADPETSEPDTADQNEFDPSASSMSRPGDTQNLSTTLQSIRPFPKAAPRQQTRKGRKRRKSAVLTDSPEMVELAAEQAESMRKKKGKPATKKTSKSTPATAPRKRGRPKKNATQTEPQPSTSSGRR
ncbi:uncharacterized protein [Temnothorax nylanderi]|uniref:uncharacterized protein n=1 Tax=Temnothorax nylanderi TaxID=102681 RepID=UPI003A88EB69